MQYLKGHDVEDIIELCKMYRADIQKKAENIKTKDIPKFEKLIVDEDEKMKRLIKAYDSFESSVENHGKEIHKAVDDAITQFKVKAKQMKQTDVQILQQQRECLHEFMSEAKQDAAQRALLQRSRNVSKLTSFKAKQRNAPILKNIIPSCSNQSPYMMTSWRVSSLRFQLPKFL